MDRVKIGCVGGGQLLRMICEEAKRNNLPFEFHALDPSKHCPASPYLESLIVGDFNDTEKIHQLAERSNILTYEIESANSAALQDIEKCGKQIHPSPETLGIIKDKLAQSRFLHHNGLPVPFSYELDRAEIEEKAKRIAPFVIKARMDGYDGRGNATINSLDDVLSATKQLEKAGLLMWQEFVNFKKELSVIAARSTTGEIKIYPVGENIHRNHQLEVTIVPARISQEVKLRAQEVAYQTLDKLKGAGVFGIEMFLTKDDQILINEIAPRVHNSGHYTIEACKTSQFEQHLRAISGMPLGSTDLVYSAVMHNILGQRDVRGKYFIVGDNKLTPVDSKISVALHMYGKEEVKPARKMGHITLTAPLDYDCKTLRKEAEILRSKIQFRIVSF